MNPYRIQGKEMEEPRDLTDQIIDLLDQAAVFIVQGDSKSLRIARNGFSITYCYAYGDRKIQIESSKGYYHYPKLNSKQKRRMVEICEQKMKEREAALQRDTIREALEVFEK